MSLMNKVIGKCSICGGRVTLPDAWYGVNPPIATCETCYATQDNLPVIKMRPTPKRNFNGDFMGVVLNKDGHTRGKISL